jgi:predicted DNA-binding protein
MRLLGEPIRFAGRTRIEEVVTMSDPITDRPVFTGQPIPLAVRVPEELARFLELLSDINGRSKTDEYRVALENHVIAAKSDKRVQDRVQQVMDEVEREAKAKRDVLSSILGPTKVTAKPAAAKTPSEPTTIK